MFKKLILTGILVTNLVGCSQAYVNETKIKPVDVQEFIDSVPYNDDFDFFQYQITEVNGDEINGVAIDNISPNNQGIVLSENIDNIHVNVGDKILVVFEKGYEDSIMEIVKVD